MSTYSSTGIYQEAIVEITMGWDPVLNRFFLVVEEIDGDDEVPLYSNLDDKELDADPKKYQSLDYFKAKLTSLKLNAPADHWAAMAKDQLNAD